MKRSLAASAFPKPETKPLGAGKAERALTVTELSRRIERLLEGEIGRVKVEGEISNFRLPQSGHAYFLLKDADCAIHAVCFRSTLSAIRVALADGKKIEVTGRVTAYTSRSEYQIVIESAREAGIGDLMRRFIELRDRLKAEGLFDPARKKALPYLPRVIGVVTSSTGAALRDILNVLNRRARGLEIIVSPCAVQGDAAPGEIVRALRRLEKHRRCEVVIVGRGGGSIEDLWSFNDERVVRAIAACSIPIVSAVGHETDTTLCDFVADLRAPTPSAAAEIVTARHAETLQLMAASRRRLDRAMTATLAERRSLLENLARSWGMRSPIERLNAAMQRADELSERLNRAPKLKMEWARTRLNQAALRLGSLRPDLRRLPKIASSRESLRQWTARLDLAPRSRLREKGLALGSLAARLESLAPKSVLKRGFSIVTRGEGKSLVTRPDQVRPGQTVRIESAGGVWRAAALPQGEDLFDSV